MSVPITKYHVILIEEGLGNLNSCFYYTREALQYAADNKVFEGKKAYANHPDKIKEQALPERDVRDIIGYYENVQVVDGNAGQALLEANLCIPVNPNLDWAHTLVQTSLDTAGKFDGDFVGLSINAAGSSSKILLESFMSENTLPISAIPKLLKAKSEGITELEVCSKLMEAVSCDLVTEAGAGGRILKILESERKRMGKKVTQNTFKQKKMKQADPGAGDDVDPTQDPGHEDLQQDIELIKSLLAEYCGSDTPTEEECQAMGAALGNAKEMGLKGKEAEEVAGHSMKMAKHVAQKQASEAEEAEAEEAGDDATAPPAAAKKAAPAAPGKKAPPAAAAGAGDEDDTDTDPQEAAKMESRIARIEADNLKLMSENNVLKLEKATEKMVRESGLPKHAQKKFSECLGTVKSEKEVTDKLKLFKEAFTVAGVELGGFNPEKTGGTSSEGFSLASCVRSDN